jgi:hypothetical protein
MKTLISSAAAIVIIFAAVSYAGGFKRFMNKYRKK